jgi:hypothetical protein
MNFKRPCGYLAIVCGCWLTVFPGFMRIQVLARGGGGEEDCRMQKLFRGDLRELCGLAKIPEGVMWAGQNIWINIQFGRKHISHQFFETVLA